MHFLQCKTTSTLSIVLGLHKTQDHLARGPSLKGPLLVCWGFHGRAHALHLFVQDQNSSLKNKHCILVQLQHAITQYFTVCVIMIIQRYTHTAFLLGMVSPCCQNIEQYKQVSLLIS